ncbi:MAG: cytochrome P450 [Acidimicrobiia bacterium]|nr:cytochrome P450 [Acidimicrobiia bacterium]
MNAPALPSPPARVQPGLFRRLFADPQPVLDELCAAYGPNVQLGVGPVRMAIIGDPATIRELFSMPTSNFKWNHKFNLLAIVVGPGSMIVSDGDDHKRRRGSVQTAFSRRRLAGWIPMIVERTDSAIDRLLAADDREHVDMYRVGRSLVLEIVIHSLFGARMTEHAAEIGDLFERAQDYLELPAYRQVPHPVPGTARARVKADRRRFDELVDAEIARCRRDPSGDPLDVLEALVVDGSLSDAEIRDQVDTLIGAGFDTTAASLAWMLWCTAGDAALWQRLRSEADHVLGPTGSDEVLGDGQLADLDLASRTVRETLRLHPAGVVSLREAVADVVLDGHRIQRGTLILWSAHLAGRDERSWERPLTFDPDRFVDPTPEQLEISRAAWVPFGGGARNCIGFALAQMELTLILSRLAQRLDIELLGDVKPRPVGMVVNRPEGGVPACIGVAR